MRLCKLTLFIILGFIITIPCQAQLTIQGTVTDSLKNPIPNVNIYATGPDSTSIKAFDYSNKNGEFSLELALNQTYLLHISSIGYKKQIIKIPAQPTPDTLARNFTLRKEIQQLKELVVEGEKPAIIAKEDTVIFIAESFMQGNEDSVEDILKQLPGITVDSQGRIKANGKTVTKVLIEDDNLFGANYTLLTKNFTAKAIETVSVYSHYHENEVLQNISKSEETVLNLGLKDEFKIDFFGTATGYYDLDQNYQVDGNVVSITKKFKGYLFESANNIGENPVGNIYNLLQSSTSFPFQSSTELGKNTGSTSFINTSPYRVSQLDQQQYLLNQTSLHALSGIYSPTDKLKIKGVSYFLPANRRINQRFTTTYDPALQLPDLIQQEQTQKDIDAGLGRMTAKYSPSQLTNIKYEGEFNTFPETNRSDRIFRNDPLQTRLKTRKTAWNQHLRFTHKVAETKAYRIRIRYKDTSTRQNLNIVPAISGGPFIFSDTTKTSLEQQSKSDGTYIGTDLKYWSKKPNGLFSVRLGVERNGNQLENSIINQPAFTDKRYWNRYRTFSTVTYRKNLFNRIEAHASLTGNYVLNKTDLKANVDDELFYISPEIGLEYPFAPKHKVQLQYTYNQDSPDFETLFSGRRLTSYRTITAGTTNFTLTPSNSFSASYQYGNWQDNFVANAFFNYITSGQSYTIDNTITPAYNLGTYRLEKNQHLLNSQLGINQFFDFLQSNLALEYTFSEINYTSFFNNTANDIRSDSHSLSTFLRTAFVGPFNAAVGADYNFSMTQNITTDNESNYHSFGGFLSSNFDIGEKFSTRAKYQYYQIENAGSYHFLNALLKYKLIEDKLTLYLNARNILDETSFQTISLGSYSNARQQDALNPRFILVGAKINIR